MTKNTIFEEDQIRPHIYLKKQRQYLLADLKYLVAQKRKFIKVPCPACGATESKVKYRKYGFAFPECPKCQTVYMSPRPPVEVITEYLHNSKNYKYWNDVIFPASEKARRQNIFVPRVDRVLEICQKNKVKTTQLVEIGCGFGTFLEELMTRKVFTSCVGIEPTPDLAETCRQKGIEVIEKTIEEIPKKTLQADVVTCFEVIEHIYSPKDFLKSCHSILRDQGLLIITCPNIQGFDVQTLGELSTVIDAEHLNYFNPDSLALLLKKVGFEVLDKQTPGVLDADLVRTQVLAKKFKLKEAFLQTVLVDKWAELGAPFQQFLQENLMSSNMWLVAQKIKK